MPRRFRYAMLVAISVCCGGAAAQPSRDATRGEWLYSTHCITCHTAQVHWRDRKLATDWNSLQANVRRWQGAAMLGWSDADIDEVARYLNAIHYRYATPL